MTAWLWNSWQAGGTPERPETMERVKGIEPSYSAWKAAALPLSYTRARPIHYHAMRTASTAMARSGRLHGPAHDPRDCRPAWPSGALNIGRIRAYTTVSINNERR